MSCDLEELADSIEHHTHYGTSPILNAKNLEKIASALRTLSSQEKQEPVAFMFWNESDTQRHFTQLRETIGSHWQNVRPIYIAPQNPPPAPGWDEAIEAACKICSFAIGQTHNMSRMAMAEELRDAIAALRANAPPDTGAGKSADVGVRVKPPLGKFAQWVEREKDGKTITLWMRTASGTHFRYSVLIDSGYGDVFGELEAALSHQPAPVAATEDDPSANERWNDGLDFAMQQLCTVMGVDPKDVTWDAATETVDGDVRAVIWNILRTKMGEDWKPAPVAANASAEARLREFTPEQITAAQKAIQSHPFFDGSAVSAFGFANAAAKALSAPPNASDCDKSDGAIYAEISKRETPPEEKAELDAIIDEALKDPAVCEALERRPHASDCDKQGADCKFHPNGGWTTKSEGGVEGHAPKRREPENADVRDGAGIKPGPSEHTDLAKDWMRQIINAGGSENVAQQAVALAALNGLFDRPSDRTADVTEEQLTEFLNELPFLIVKPFSDDDECHEVARALLDAFTVGMR